MMCNKNIADILLILVTVLSFSKTTLRNWMFRPSGWFLVQLNINR